MFPGAYFAARYYPPRYFGKVGAAPVVVTYVSGTFMTLTGVGA